MMKNLTRLAPILLIVPVLLASACSEAINDNRPEWQAAEVRTPEFFRGNGGCSGAGYNIPTLAVVSRCMLEDVSLTSSELDRVQPALQRLDARLARDYVRLNGNVGFLYEDFLRDVRFLNREQLEQIARNIDEAMTPRRYP